MHASLHMKTPTQTRRYKNTHRHTQPQTHTQTHLLYCTPILTHAHITYWSPVGVNPALQLGTKCTETHTHTHPNGVLLTSRRPETPRGEGLSGTPPKRNPKLDLLKATVRVLAGGIWYHSLLIHTMAGHLLDSLHQSL